MLLTESHFGGSNPSTTANTMEFLNIKEKNLSIIIPLKNGHTLLYTTFIHLFKHFKIEVELETDQSKVLNNSYIFVRNPIDRFFSSYYWLEHMSNVGETKYKENILKNMELLKINDVNSFIQNYENFVNLCNDFHYIPQSSQILFKNNQYIKEEIINPSINLNELYENKFLKNYNLFKIEDINHVIEENVNLLISQNIGFKDKMIYSSFNLEFKNFEFLNEFPKEFNFLFITFYSFYKNYYQFIQHHRNIDYISKITFHEYEKVRKITKNEYDFFEYDKKVIDYKLFKKNMI